MTDDQENQQLRVAALKNVEAIFNARQRAERDLVTAKTALEMRTEELLVQREWFEVTLASIGDAVITTDIAGRVTMLNPVAETLTGWRTDEALGKPLHSVFRIVNEETREPVENPVDKVLESGKVVGLANQTALISRAGAEVSIEDSAAPIRDRDGAVTGAVMVFHDVSQRRMAERALRASEERLSAVFSQAAVGIAVATLDGRFEEANLKFCAVLGYTVDELRDLTFLELTHPDDLVATLAKVQELREGKIDNYALEKRYLRKDGSVVWSSTTVTLLRKENGEAAQFIGIIQDITDRKESEEALAHLAAVVEHSDDAIITKTLTGKISSWNPGATRIFGYNADEAIGQPVTLLIPEQHLDEEPGILERLRRGERIDHYETTRRRKDGTLINVSLTVSPIKNANGRIVGASKIARDITQQKRAEELIREQARVLRETDQRKDEFLATLAHELRNPLAPIRQATRISMAPNTNEEQKRWSHEVITRQVNHMSLLLDDLLDISRITRGTLELRTQMTDLAAVVDSAVETSRPAMDAKQHQFLLDLPQEPVRFAADPLRLAQVLSNLLTNAAKYTDPHGKIHLHASADAGTIEISVTDTGIGISPEALSGLFTMFSQVKSTQDRSEGGLGIGLALSKGVVLLHGGTIEAQSAGTGHGSCFVVRIPRRNLIATHNDAPAAPAPVLQQRRRVLIADDNRDAAESLAMLLQMDGHEVAVVHDGKQALAHIETSRPEVALLDIGMPEIDGYEVARRVRGNTRISNTLLIAVTGWGQEADKSRASTAGFDLHFTKPVDPERLVELLGGELLTR